MRGGRGSEKVPGSKMQGGAARGARGISRVLFIAVYRKNHANGILHKR